MSLTAQDLLSLDCSKVAVVLIMDALENGYTEEAEELLHKYVPGHFGWEPIQPESFYDTPIGQYLNMGDTYDATVVVDYETGEFMLTSWGDFVEQWERDNPEEVYSED